MNLSNFINLNSFWWWINISLNFLGFLLLRFGMVSEGRRRGVLIVIEFFGGMLIFLSFISMFFWFDILFCLALLIIFWFIITPIVEIIIRKIFHEI